MGFVEYSLHPECFSVRMLMVFKKKKIQNKYGIYVTQNQSINEYSMCLKLKHDFKKIPSVERKQTKLVFKLIENTVVIVSLTKNKSVARFASWNESIGQFNYAILNVIKHYFSDM